MIYDLVKSNVIECRELRPWLVERKKRIQASDGAAIVGESSWGTRVSVYTDKVTDVPDVVETSEEFDDGHDMEPVVCSRVAKKFGMTVHRWPEYSICVNPEHDWLACTPDAIVFEKGRPGPGNMQIKSWSEMDRAAWADGPPVEIQIQCQLEMFDLGVEWGIVAVKIGRIVERFYTEPNHEFIAAIVPVLHDFRTLVEMRTMPSVDSSPATTRALYRLHPNDNGKTAQLPAEFDTRIDRLRRLKALRGEIKRHITGLENELKAAIGDNTYGRTHDGQWVKWPTRHREESYVAASDYRELEIDVNPPKRIEYAATSPLQLQNSVNVAAAQLLTRS